MATRKGNSEPIGPKRVTSVTTRPPAHSSTFPGMLPGAPHSHRPVFKLNWSANHRGSSHRPSDVCFLEDKNVAVAEKKKSRIRIYDGKGEEVLLIDREKCPGLLQPSTLLPYNAGEQLLLAVDLNQIHYFQQNGHYDQIWQPHRSGSTKRAEASYNCLHGVTLTRDNEFVVSDISSKPTVSIFSPKTRKLKRDLKLPGGETFKKPYYMCCNPVHGQIYVSDCENHCVYEFDGQGRYLNKLGHNIPMLKDRLLYPLGLDNGRQDELWVCDQANDRISAFSLNAGKFMHHVLTSHEGLEKPVGVRVSEDKCNLVVTEECLHHKTDTNSVKVFQILPAERKRSSLLHELSANMR